MQRLERPLSDICLYYYCISLLDAALVLPYLTDVGFLVAYPLVGQCEGLKGWVSNQVEAPVFFMSNLMPNLE